MPTPERIAALLALGDPFASWPRERRRLAAYVLWRRRCQPKAWTRVRIAADLGISPSRCASLETRGLERLAEALLDTWPDDRLDARSPLGQAVASFGAFPPPAWTAGVDPEPVVWFEGHEDIEWWVRSAERHAAARAWYDPPPRAGRAVLPVESFDGQRGLLMLPGERGDAADR